MNIKKFFEINQAKTWGTAIPIPGKGHVIHSWVELFKSVEI